MLGETSEPASRAAAPSELVRGLGPWQATAVVVSTIIGTGVFLVAGPMARAAGSFDLFLLTWIAGSVIALSGALCFAELGAALPAAGGLYCYLSRGLGPVWGFMYGWMQAVLGSPVGFATIAAGFVRFASYLLPQLDKPWLTLHAGPLSFTLDTAQPLAALVVLCMTALNCLSVRIGGGVQMFLGSLKIGAIGVIIVAAALWIGGTAGTSPPAPILHSSTAVGAVLTAMVPVMWAYNGFQNLGCLGAEVRDPGRSIPIAILGGMLIVGTLYVLLDVLYCHVLPFGQVASSGHVASDVVQVLFGRRGADWLTLAMGISALATLHAVIMAESRITYALSRSGLFFEFAGRVQPRFRSPQGALLFLGGLGAVIALTGTFEQLFSLYIFAIWIFFALGALALLRLRATEPELPRPYRTLGYPWTPLLFLTAALALTTNLWLDQPVRSSIGLLMILAGLPCYYAWLGRSRRLAQVPTA
ncbi:MAG TPA: amino acid permease [Steroidobacteraceae bacterium]|nr:amino acid permease [Steroidobacteraceae bacterium]